MRSAEMRERDPAVLGLLLQQHLELLRRNTASKLTNRVLFFTLISIPILKADVAFLHVVLLWLVAYFLGMLWFSENRSSGRQLQALEETLARYTGGDWEDVYIRSRHYVVDRYFGVQLSRFEPLFWLAVATMLVIARYLLHTNLIAGA